MYGRTAYSSFLPAPAGQCTGELVTLYVSVLLASLSATWRRSFAAVGLGASGFGCGVMKKSAHLGTLTGLPLEEEPAEPLPSPWMSSESQSGMVGLLLSCEELYMYSCEKSEVVAKEVVAVVDAAVDVTGNPRQ